MTPLESFYLGTGILSGVIAGCCIAALVCRMIHRLECNEIDDILKECTSLREKLMQYYDYVRGARWERRHLKWHERLSDTELRKVKEQIDSLYKRVNKE